MKLIPAEIIENATLSHGIDEIWGLFSGGHDSIISSHIASQAPLFKGILHIDTGIGIPETQQYVIDVCDRYGWNLKIYRAVDNTKADGSPDPMIYRNLVLRYGFPGANLHQFMYSRLKERQINRFVRDQKENGAHRIGLITGARASESDRRMRNFKQGSEIYRREGSKVWVAPILLFNSNMCDAYMRHHELPRNPVKQNLCISGECLCGAFAKRNELTQIDFFYPEVGERIRALEAEIKAKGFSWGWEEQPPKCKRQRKEQSDELFSSPLCYSCKIKFEPN